jgi:hypothetical protein
MNVNYSNAGYGGNIPGRRENDGQKALMIVSVSAGGSSIWGPPIIRTRRLARGRARVDAEIIDETVSLPPRFPAAPPM